MCAQSLGYETNLCLFLSYEKTTFCFWIKLQYYQMIRRCKQHVDFDSSVRFVGSGFVCGSCAHKSDMQQIWQA